MNVYWAIPYKTVTFSEEKRQKNQICFFRFSTNWRTMDCVTSEMHKFTIKQENKLEYFHLWTCYEHKITLYNVCSVHQGIIQYIGGVHYIRGCSVHWGNIMSTSEVLST